MDLSKSFCFSSVHNSLYEFFQKNFRVFRAVLTGTIILVFSYNTAAQNTKAITFEGLTTGKINECWGGMGIDNEDRIYIGLTGYYGGSSQEDVGVFRWDSRTDQKSFLGTFRGVAKSFGNLPSDSEEMPKGHTMFVLQEDKIYMGSQSFHDFKANLDGLNTYRGGHLFSFDVKTEKWDDISSRQPDGVMIKHDGLLVLEAVPSSNYLASVSHPNGRVILYNKKTDAIEKIFDATPWSSSYFPSRQIITEKPGFIYTSRNHEFPDQRNQNGKIWEHDLANGTSRLTSHTFKGGFFNGKSTTSDSKRVYLTTTNGEIYLYDVVSDKFEHLGHFLPASDYSRGDRIRHIYGHVMSLDEKKLYAIPSWERNNLYEYDIEKKTVAMLKAVNSGVYVSYNLFDSKGNIYFAHWQSGSGNAHLLQVDVSNRTGPAPDSNKVQSPYPGPAPFVLPGKLEAEHFDNGGEGVAYHDGTTGNNWNYYRPGENVDIKDAGTEGPTIGFTSTPGEWTEYTVDIPSGTYSVTIRTATIHAGKKLTVKLGDGPSGSNFVTLGTIPVPVSSSWSVQQTSLPVIFVIANGGTAKVLRLEREGAEGTDFDLNWIDFEMVNSTFVSHTDIRNPSSKGNDQSYDIRGRKILLTSNNRAGIFLTKNQSRRVVIYSHKDD